MKNTTGWQKFNPTIVEKDHKHYYHTAIRNKKQDKCSFMAGHTHKVKVNWAKDKDGNAYVKNVECGPPLQQKHIKGRGANQYITKLVPIHFKRDFEEDDIVDSHTHPVEYLGGEVISTEKIRQRVEVDKTQLKALMESEIKPAVVEPAPKAPAPEAPKAGAND